MTTLRRYLIAMAFGGAIVGGAVLAVHLWRRPVPAPDAGPSLPVPTGYTAVATATQPLARPPGAPRGAKATRHVEGTVEYGERAARDEGGPADASSSHVSNEVAKPEARLSLCDLRPEDLAGGCTEDTIDLGGGVSAVVLNWTARLRLPKGAACVDESGRPQTEVVRGPKVIKQAKAQKAPDDPPPAPAPAPFSWDLHAGVSSSPGWVVGATVHGRGRLGGTVLYEQDLLSPDRRLVALASFRIGRK